MAPQEGKLPSWTVVGAKGKWHSESTKAVHTVVVTSVDLVKRRVVVHFEADHKVWKTVPFAYVGGNGPLQPYDGGAKELNKDGKEAGVASQQVANQQAGSKAAGKGEKPEEDGTATPPWYEQLNEAETREEVKHDKKRAELEVTERQMERQKRWQQAQKQRVEEEARRREEERRRSEEAAEKERLRILEKLRVERELEQLRQRELQFMQVEDALSDRYVNGPLRLAERRVQEEKERQLAERLREEEAARREKESKFREEVANRPLISFGVKFRQEPVRLGHPQLPPQQQHVDQQEPAAPPAEGEPLLDLDALAAAQRWADAYSAGAVPADHNAAPASDGHETQQQVAAIATAAATAGNPYDGYHQQQHATYPAAGGQDCGHGYEDQDHVRASTGEVGHDTYGGAWDQAATAAPSSEQVSAAEYYGSRITAIYSQHNPAKLQDVPALMAKYVGCEAEMYERVCEKYGVEPDPHLERPEPEDDALVQQTASAKRAPAPPMKGKVARKAAAPSPPDTLNEADAPSSSDLMARFASLVTVGDDPQAERGGAVSSGSKPQRSSDQRKRLSGGAAAPSSSRRHEERDLPGVEAIGSRSSGRRRHDTVAATGSGCGCAAAALMREPPPRSAPSSKSRHGGREDSGYRDGGHRDNGSGGYRWDRDSSGYRDVGTSCGAAYWAGGDSRESGGRDGYRYADEGFRDRRSRSRSRERERYSDQGGYWEEGRGGRGERENTRRNVDPPWRQRGGSTGRGYY